MTLPMGSDLKRTIDNMQAALIVLAAIVIVAGMTILWNQGRIGDLESEIREIHRSYDQCAEDNGWNPVIGCFDLD